ncbi:DUF4158 domain-containing protein [Streptomyces sp. KLMMK]|uniref:DUF4158 domain-containing protein n=1 Tax=Streptomyces sp. KLMMK TaxID=3109353 RepID=UPI00300BDB9A
MACQSFGGEPVGFALLLKFFEVEAPFPEDAGEIPVPVVSYVAQQVRVPAEEWAAYDWSGRAIKRHRMEIRGAFGFHECTEEDQSQLAEWLAVELCGVELNRDRLAEAVVARCRKNRLEPPGLRALPSTSTSTGTCMWSVSHTWFRQPRGRARNTSCLRAARSPPASPARSPGVRSRRIARCSVGIDGASAGGDCRAARRTSSR